MNNDNPVKDDPIVIVRSAAPDGEQSTVGVLKVGKDLTVKTAGTQHISMRHGILPPGKKASAHYHPFETVIYVIRGKHHTYFGPNLEHCVEVQPGDYVYIPAYTMHQPVNDGEEEMEFVAAQPAPDEIALLPPGAEEPYHH